MESQPGEVAYAAFTDAATYMLDADGICRWTVARPGARGTADAALAERCVGAQYVASLDVQAQGGLIEIPRVGCSLLFARLDEHGRISLLRTGPIVRFEDRTARDQGKRTLAARGAGDSGVHPTPRAQAAAPPVPEIDPYADESATMRFSPAQILKAMHAVPPDETLEPPSTLPATLKVPPSSAPRRGVLPRRRGKSSGPLPLPPPPRVHAGVPAKPASGVLPTSGDDPAPASDPLVALRAGRGRRG